MLNETAEMLASLPPVVESLVKLTVLLVLAWSVAPLVRRARPRWQVLYWRGAALTTALLPLAVLLGPAIPIPVLEKGQVNLVASAGPISTAESSSVEPLWPTADDEIVADVVPPVVEREAASAVESQPATRQVRGWTWSEVLAVSWLLPAAALLAGALLRGWRTRRLIGCAEAAPVEMGDALARVACDLGYRRSIRVYVSTEVDSPRVTGWLRPVILLPKTDVDESDLAGILAHEVSHLVSHDLPWSRVVQLLSIGFWFHPLVWGLGRRHLDACERVSDGVAAEYVGDADAYAGILARVALGVLGGRALAGIAMARSPKIKERLLRLAAGAAPLRRRQVVLACAAGLILLVGVGGVRLVETQGAGAEGTPARASGDAAEVKGAKQADELISVNGQVVDQAGVAVAGATVHLREWSNFRVSENPGLARIEDVLATTKTDGDGRFEFADVPARPLHRYSELTAPWDVVCQHEGFGMAWQHLPAAKSEAPLCLRLAPEVSIEGDLVDQSGSPIADAHVEVYRISALGADWHSDDRSPWTLDLSRSELAPVGRSDAQGHVVIRGLPADLRATLIITHDDFSREVVYVATTDVSQPPVPQPGRGPDRVTKPTFSRQFSVEMKPAGPTIRGRVTLADTGEPCANAQVAIRSSVNGYRYTMTDAEGEYVIRDALEGTKFVSVSLLRATGYLNRFVGINIDGVESEKIVDMELIRGHWITGSIVVEETGQGVEGSQVVFESVHSDKPLNVTTARAVSDAAGQFRMLVPEGRSRLLIGGTVDGCLLPRIPTEAGPDSSRYCRDIEVVEGKLVEPVRFLVGRGKVVEGIVTDGKGKPVSGARVRSLRNHDLQRYEEHETTTDASGRFELGGFRTLARLQLVITHLDPAQGARIEIDESGEKASIEVTMQPTATFTGIVLVDGKPQANVSINLQQTLRDGEQMESLFHQNTQTNSEGRYRFERIIPGTGYVVSIMTEEVTDEHVWNLEARAGETRELDPMEVASRTASVSGIVVDPDGNPVEGVTVSADFRSGKRLSRAFTEVPTGKDGRFSVVNLPDEPLTLMAYILPTPGSTDRTIRSPSRVDVEPNQTDVRILLDPRLVRKTPIPVRRPK